MHHQWVSKGSYLQNLIQRGALGAEQMYEAQSKGAQSVCGETVFAREVVTLYIMVWHVCFLFFFLIAATIWAAALLP